MEYFLFYLFSTVALLSALMVIWSTNPVSSVLYLVLVFCNGTGLLLLLQVEFMAMIFLVVYVGAIAVLFLFVVMMLAPKSQEEGFFSKSSLEYLPLGLLLVSVFAGEVYLVVNGDFVGLNSPTMLPSPEYLSWIHILDGAGSSTSNLETLGQVLYTYYFYYFLVAGFVLLVGMIGAIVLTLQPGEESARAGMLSKRQQIFEQMSRDSQNAIFTVDLKNK
jgi:NADH-quinone oxidoreductase subunit J